MKLCKKGYIPKHNGFYENLKCKDENDQEDDVSTIKILLTNFMLLIPPHYFHYIPQNCLYCKTVVLVLIALCLDYLVISC